MNLSRIFLHGAERVAHGAFGVAFACQGQLSQRMLDVLDRFQPTEGKSCLFNLSQDERCLVLCFAAAIAESEGE